MGVGLIAFQLYMGQEEKTKIDTDQLIAISDTTLAGVDNVTIINRENSPFAEFHLNKKGVDTIQNSKDAQFAEMKKSINKSEEKDKTKILFVIEELDPTLLAENLKEQLVFIYSGNVVPNCSAWSLIPL